MAFSGPPAEESFPARLHGNLFGNWTNTIGTLVFLWLLYHILSPLLSWGILDAVWRGDSGTCRAARAAGESGACWPAITHNYRFILFGFYPVEEQWRPALAVFLNILAVVASCNAAFWSRRLLWLWAATLLAMLVLMFGGVAGLSWVGTDAWGGIPVTLLLAEFGVIGAMPFGILLALGRRSTLPVIRVLSTCYIELIRGVPLITILFMASLLFPLFMPEGVNFDKLLRAQAGFVCFLAAYIAEIVRGGLQGLPKGQYEAADSLGLSWGQKMRLVILPQALRLVIPPLVNTFIASFKDTTLIILIGLYDVLNAARTVLNTAPEWRAFVIEGLVFGAIFFFVCSFFISRYSQYVERVTGVAGR